MDGERMEPLACLSPVSVICLAYPFSESISTKQVALCQCQGPEIHSFIHSFITCLSLLNWEPNLRLRWERIENLLYREQHVINSFKSFSVYVNYSCSFTQEISWFTSPIFLIFCTWELLTDYEKHVILSLWILPGKTMYHNPQLYPAQTTNYELKIWCKFVNEL